MPSPPPPRLLRAALLGAAFGLVIAGRGLFFTGVHARLAVPGCEGLSENECKLEREVRTGASRLQLVGGAGLTLLGVGALLWQRGADLRQGSRPPDLEAGP